MKNNNRPTEKGYQERLQAVSSVHSHTFVLKVRLKA